MEASLEHINKTMGELSQTVLLLKENILFQPLKKKPSERRLLKRNSSMDLINVTKVVKEWKPCNRVTNQENLLITKYKIYYFSMWNKCSMNKSSNDFILIFNLSIHMLPWTYHVLNLSVCSCWPNTASNLWIERKQHWIRVTCL